MTAPVLSIRGLQKSFGGLLAVEGFDFDLLPGLITALIGPNGAGKTTVFNMVTGVLTADAGSVVLRGAAAAAGAGEVGLLGLSPHRVAALGVSRTFQDLRLFSRMTVRDNVLAVTERTPWLWQRGTARTRHARVEAALEQTGLASRAGVRAVDLPYADAKFLSLARVLATDAPVWLLDEPASGLDPASRDRFCALLRGAAAAGTTICLIEHNLDIVAALSDRIAFLDRGRKLAEGEPDAILRDKELAAIYFGEKRG